MSLRFNVRSILRFLRVELEIFEKKNLLLYHCLFFAFRAALISPELFLANYRSNLTPRHHVNNT